MGRKKSNVLPFKPYESTSPDGYENHYIRITNSLFSSDAKRSLTPLAWNLYESMLIEARGHPSVIFSQQMGKESLGCSCNGYTKCIKQLIEKGFIKRKPRSCFSASEYIFSDEWKNY